MPHKLDSSAFLMACSGRRPSHVPVWFMRQAGRSLPEYRKIRGEGSISQAISDPDVATEITLQPVRRYGVDAAILFSDIVTPIQATGFQIDIAPGVGPVAETPVRNSDDVRRLKPLDPEADMPYVLETVRNLVADLEVPLIGFAGAPFTVASYLVEGGPSRHKATTKAMMADSPDLFASLMDHLADIAIASLEAQIHNGAAAVQLFDSWAGCLSPGMYERHVLPTSGKILSALAHLGVPRIHFGTHTGELLTLMRDAGADVVGVDWLVPLDEARRKLGESVVLQGNLDPAICLASWGAVEPEVDQVLSANAGNPGYIFNLGHGVLPSTDPAILAQVVDHVHRRGSSHEIEADIID